MCKKDVAKHVAFWSCHLQMFQHLPFSSRSLWLPKRYRRRPRPDGNVSGLMIEKKGWKKNSPLAAISKNHLNHQDEVPGFTSSHFLQSAFFYLVFKFSRFFPPLKTASSQITITAKAVKVWKPPVVHRPLRVACLHGTCSNGNITKASRKMPRAKLGCKFWGWAKTCRRCWFYMSVIGEKTLQVCFYFFSIVFFCA